MKKIAIIPSLEPDHHLIDITKELKENDYEVIIVNDGSSNKYDKYFETTKDYATVLTHKTNQGKGVALKTAFKYIKENYGSPYLIITVDSDGQHKIDDCNKIMNYLQKHPNDLVLGKRIRSMRTPLRSKVGNAITRKVYQLVSNIDIYDTQTGLRAFSDKLIDRMLEIPGERFEYEINMPLYLANEKIKITEIEIETIYIESNKSSHFNPIKDSYKIYKEIFKYCEGGVISFVIDYLLYTLFNVLKFKVATSNITARLISSFINYNMSKKYVFQKSSKYSLLKYYLLVIANILINTFILTNIIGLFKTNIYLTKIIIEIVMFFINYLIQKIFIYKNLE